MTFHAEERKLTREPYAHKQVKVAEACRRRVPVPVRLHGYLKRGFINNQFRTHLSKWANYLACHCMMWVVRKPREERAAERLLPHTYSIPSFCVAWQE